MPRVVFYPYKMNSQSCKTLQDAMQQVGHTTLRVYPDRKYKPRDDDFIINWGSSTRPIWGSPDLNAPEAVAKATDKIKTFNTLCNVDVPIPERWTDKETAEAIRASYHPGHIFLARTTVTGHSGQGIVIVRPGEPLPDAPLYTRYVGKTHEYRVHIFNGEILDVQEKRRRNGAGGRDTEYIWNVSTDFVFCREGVEAPEYVKEQALKSVEALGLSFGAVDVGWDNNDWSPRATVYEVNTAPGLTGTTLTKYVEKLSECL